MGKKPFTNPRLHSMLNQEIAAKAESLGHLPVEWLKISYQEKWFKLFVPKVLGGLGLTLPEALHVEEQLASLDASLGWTVTLCAGAGWFVGFMEESLRNEVFSDPKVCLAGSGYVGGKAKRVGNFYQVSGSWTYASGALHATHFTANCEILEDGNPLVEADGKPLVKAFILKKEEVEILDGWNYMGMIATGSHAFKTENMVVPAHRAFDILPEKATLSQPVYHYPFLQLAEATLAVNILGITFHLQRLISDSFWKRNSYRKYENKQLDYFQVLEKNSQEKLVAQKDAFYEKVNSSWFALEKEGFISEEILQEVSQISRTMTQTCREINATMYPFAGLEAAKTHTELNRVWRDFNTVSQHALLIFPF